MTTGHVLMGLLRRGQQHGYDLKRRHDALFPAARPMAFGQVYAALGRLVDKEWLRVAGTAQDAGPERTLFELTDEGRAELDRWVAEADGPGEHIANPLASKLTVSLLVGGRAGAEAYLRAQRAAHLDRMRELTRARREESDLATTLAADYALSHLDADVRWMEEAHQRLDEMEKGTAR